MSRGEEARSTTADDPFPEEGTRDNSVLMYLRENGPSVLVELPRKPGSGVHRWMGRLDVGHSRRGGAAARGRTNTVYYLYGDERRAVRKYIDENTEFVRSCMDDRVNPINMGMEDYWWQMFCEEWVWRDGT